MATGHPIGSVIDFTRAMHDRLPDPGICRHCGCTEKQACRVGPGVPCHWANAEHTICSQPDCVRYAIRELVAGGSWN